MKKFMLIFLFPLMLWGQDDVPHQNLRFQHLSLIIGGGPVEDSFNTVNFGLEAGFSLEKHLFKASFLSGGPTRTFWDTEPYGNFVQVNLLYGREFAIQSWLLVDAHAGAGYFSFGAQNPNGSGDTVQNNTIGFPLEGSLKIPLWKWVRLGFRVHHNFNSIRNVTSFGGLLEFRF